MNGKAPIQNARRLYHEALLYLEGGDLECAKEKLSQAAALLDKIPNNDRSLQQKIVRQQALVTRDIRHKRTASNLVARSEEEDDPEKSLELLENAREFYARYPQIDDLIQAALDRIRQKTLRELRNDRQHAQGLFEQRNFVGARMICQRASARGRRFDLDDSEFNKIIDQFNELNKKIDRGERKQRRFLEKIRRIEKALESRNFGLAQRLLNRLSPAEAQETEAIDLRQRLAHLQLWNEAQQAFAERQDYEQTIALCEKLSQAPDFISEARALRIRAQARLWWQQASSIDADAQFDKAAALYKQIIVLGDNLPPEDSDIVDAVTTALAELEKTHAQINAQRQQLEQIRNLRLRNQWRHWHQKLQHLESEAHESVHDDLVTERRIGIETWELTARGQAQAALENKSLENIRPAYEMLQSLNEIGVVPGQDSLFVDIAIHYFSVQAEYFEAIGDLDSLDEAVECRLQAAKFAHYRPNPREKDALARSIWRRALMRAKIAAEERSPGEAIIVLQQQFDKFPHELKDNPVCHRQMIWYALQARNLYTARREARILEIIAQSPGEDEEWLELVNVVAVFYESNDIRKWELSVERLGKLHARYYDPLFASALTTFSAQVAAHIQTVLAAHAELEPSSQLRVFRIIHILNPDNAFVVDEVQRLDFQLENTAQKIIASVEGTNHQPPTEWRPLISQFENLDVQLNAALLAFELIGHENSSTAQQLQQVQANVHQRIQQLRKFGLQIEQVDIQWWCVVQGDWDIANLEFALQQASQLASQANIATIQISDWRDRIEQLKQTIAALESISTAIKQYWVSGQYDEAGAACNRLAEQIEQSRSALKTDRLVLPISKLEVYDNYTHLRHHGLDEIRRIASEKANNLIAWRRWTEQYAQIETRIRDIQEDIIRELKTQPPCLSRGKEQLEALLHEYTQFQQLSILPPEPLSQEAAQYAEHAHHINIQEECEREIQIMHDKLAEVEEALETLQEPLTDLHRFILSHPNFRSQVAENTFSRLVKAVHDIDSCHPELEQVLELYKRMAGKDFECRK